jgi:hypothetical protein
MGQMKTPPDRLIGENKKPNFGLYNAPITNLNLDDFDYRTLGRLTGKLGAKAARLAKKRWQYLGVFDERIVAGVAVVHLSYIGSTFAYVYDRQTRRLKEINLIDPGAGKTVFSKNSISGTSSLKTVSIENGESNVIDVDAKGLKMKVQVDTPAGGFNPLAICVRNGLHGFNYTHKAAGLVAKGYVEVDGERYDLGENALGVFDWTAGCAAKVTFWNWASAAGRLPDGRICGINFVSGINDMSFTENVVWVDGVPTKVDVAHFDYDSDNILGPWKITSNDGKVDLLFSPEGERRENQNFGVIASKFRQPFGSFSGTIKTEKEELAVDSVYGFVEEHFVRW